MFWKKTILVLILLAATAWGAYPAHAQAGSPDLPDLSGLAGAIEQSVKDAPPPPAPPQGKLFDSGLPVPSVHPGQSARDYGRKWREGIEKKTGPNPAMQKLEAAMPAVLTGTETMLVKQGFAKRDMGVAVGVFMVGNWEVATKHNLSDQAQAATVRSFAVNPGMEKWKSHYLALSPTTKENCYETLLVSTMLMSLLSQSFDKAGKTQAADGMRRIAATQFQALSGMPVSQMTIGPDGRVSTTAPATAVPTAGATPPPDTQATPMNASSTETLAPPTDASPADASPLDAPTSLTDSPPKQ